MAEGVYESRDSENWFYACGHCGFESRKVGKESDTACWRCGRALERIRYAAHHPTSQKIRELGKMKDLFK